MDEAARGKVVQADLRAQGIDDFGEMQAGVTWGSSSPGLELFFQDEPMTLARWPNQGFDKISTVLGSDARGCARHQGLQGRRFSPTQTTARIAGPERRTSCSTAIGSGTGPTSD